MVRERQLIIDDYPYILLYSGLLDCGVHMISLVSNFCSSYPHVFTFFWVKVQHSLLSPTPDPIQILLQHVTILISFYFPKNLCVIRI